MSVVDVTPDFKAPGRIVDRPALDRAMQQHRDNTSGRCIACRRERATEPHHIVFRSNGGDDVVENIAPLCSFCHRIFHYGQTDEKHEAAVSIGKGLSDENIAYALRKLGVEAGTDYLRRRYYVNKGKVPAKYVNWVTVDGSIVGKLKPEWELSEQPWI